MFLPLRLLGLLCVPLLSSCTTLSAKTLRITSTPPGATVELDEAVVGKTPFEQDFPAGYFRRSVTIFEKRLGHPMRLRLTLPGYVTQEVVLTNGPKQWLDLHHNNRGEYWLFKSDEFRFDLIAVPPDAPEPPGTEPRTSHVTNWTELVPEGLIPGGDLVTITLGRPHFPPPRILAMSTGRMPATGILLACSYWIVPYFFQLPPTFFR